MFHVMALANSEEFGLIFTVRAKKNPKKILSTVIVSVEVQDVERVRILQAKNRRLDENVTIKMHSVLESKGRIMATNAICPFEYHWSLKSPSTCLEIHQTTMAYKKESISDLFLYHLTKYDLGASLTTSCEQKFAEIELKVVLSQPTTYFNTELKTSAEVSVTPKIKLGHGIGSREMLILPKQIEFHLAKLS